jgi:hypothetical protein
MRERISTCTPRDQKPTRVVLVPIRIKIHVRLRLPKDVIPAAPKPLTSEQETDPVAKAIYEATVKLHDEFIASL